MSIPNLIHKIKGDIDIDKINILFPLIIIGVGVSSFALGRFSIQNNENSPQDKEAIIITESGYLSNSSSVNSKEPSKQSVQSGEKRYVASKNGKMYYSLGCSGAKRIKAENEVWFSSAEDAEKSGYTKATSCK